MRCEYSQLPVARVSGQSKMRFARSFCTVDVLVGRCVVTIQGNLARDKEITK
jgi:hypothetical protein